MKYTPEHPPLQCYMRQSTWYNSAGPGPVRGGSWHSTGANNPGSSRYVELDYTATDPAGPVKLWEGN